MPTRSVDEHARAVTEMLDRVSMSVTAAPPELLSIQDPDLVGRIVARPLRSAIPLPPFTNAQMDGYAVRSEDLAHATPDRPVILPLGQITAAGAAPRTHRPGTASPVMTGAALPDGADAVVPVEQTEPPSFPFVGTPRAERDGDEDPEPTSHANAVAFASPVEPGRFVRGAGEDLPAGSRIAHAGALVTATRIGLIASTGITEVPVVQRPRILLITTGDEVAGPSQGLPRGRIFDANAPMLGAALTSQGAIVNHLHCPDQVDLLLSALREHASRSDLVVTSGGISAGAFEVVRDALTPLGVEFMPVAMQPGGPQGLGEIDITGREAPLPVLCFPGNPVSSMLSAEVFLVPWLRALRGEPAQRPRRTLPLAHPADSPAEKLQLRRGTVTPDESVVLSAPGSHLLSDLADADVIAEIPVGIAHADAGTPITTWRINDRP